MIKYKISLDSGVEYFVAARSMREAIDTLTLRIECSELTRPRIGRIGSPEIVGIELWNTEDCKHLKLPVLLGSG